MYSGLLKVDICLILTRKLRISGIEDYIRGTGADRTVDATYMREQPSETYWDYARF